MIGAKIYVERNTARAAFGFWGVGFVLGMLGADGIEVLPPESIAVGMLCVLLGGAVLFRANVLGQKMKEELDRNYWQEREARRGAVSDGKGI